MPKHLLNSVNDKIDSNALANTHWSEASGAELPIRDNIQDQTLGTSAPLRTTSLADPSSGTSLVNNLGKPFSKEYYFRGSMSEELLHKYLDKVLEVHFLSRDYHSKDSSWKVGPSIPDSYNAFTNPSVLFDTSYDHGRLLCMIINTGAKFVSGMVSHYGGPENDHELEKDCKTMLHDINYIHSHDPDIICGAGLSEFGTRKGLASVSIPKKKHGIDIVKMFYPSGRPHHYGPFFEYPVMVRDFDKCNRLDQPEYSCELNIMSPETQMWYYYLATCFIDSGCEALHFGDLFNVCKDDKSHKNVGYGTLWGLVEKIRAYAALRARRRIVLLSTHTHSGWYYDPDFKNKEPFWKRRLIFDFHSLGTYYRRDSTKIAYDSWFGNCEYPVKLDRGMGILNRSGGGLHPQGWYCSHCPALTRFDNGNNHFFSGSSFPVPSDPTLPDCYGFENTSWFAFQGVALRQAILKYTYYKIKCLDPYNHFGMPGRLIIHKLEGGKYKERYYNDFTEENTIKKLWSNDYVGPRDWAPHNFTEENLAKPDIPPKSSLIMVGADKMYFIGTDGYIHGYIRNNGSYNGGNWLTVSPSYSAQGYYGQNVSGQVKAKSDLVASPDGKMLLYIGHDSYIHGFEMDAANKWKYYHISNFMKLDMKKQFIFAENSLIFPTNSQIYYIAKQIDGTKRVHGFQKGSGTWKTVSPSFSAQYNFGFPVPFQLQAAGSLTYEKSTHPNRLYYRATNGHLAYFEVHDMVVYKYVACPGNAHLVIQNLIIIGNLAIVGNRIYYVGRYGGDLSYRIHCLIDNGGGHWTTVSPSYSAGGSPSLQSYFDGNIAVSPDGKTIVYFPAIHTGFIPSLIVPYLCCFTTGDGFSFQYRCFNTQISRQKDWIHPGNSLQFVSNSEFFLISSAFPFDSVQHFKYEESFCNNQQISNYANI